ncbi:sensor histidine kinase [Bosea sp. (in: a-proteobacteria)]|uniref:sensor histidine kinase n=1 Tax=Bosea sp. (in: a-proteobacteria) TaxID=1871050 RepID=UPI002B466D00|nr:HWE histidine kinase domain-containing protein [Bosea sp. (in: a-proteobacteria)]WRH59983.1 MAG: HWE histidine kinase domain-containing protein [Bosea sp. (in: a-proteobacteria)]
MPLPFSHWTPDSLRRAIQAAGVALWSWNIEKDTFVMDEQGFAMWAVDETTELVFEDLSARIHPADRDRVRAAFTATRGIEGAYEIDFRIMIGDDIRWISARGLGNDSGLHQGHMYGIFLDVTGRKQAEEGHELLAGEMSHRVKNLLAIASGLTQIASRSSTTAAEMAKDLTSRLTSLGRAHDLVRPLPGHQGTAALLGDLLSILLSPYEDMGAFSGRIRVAVPRMGVGEGAATTLALVIHELATNSVKYGALSADEGTLDVSGSLDGDDIKIVWMERGGPVVEPSKVNGYGSRLVARSVTGQLSGAIDYAWEPEGLIVTLTLKALKLAR